MLDHNHKPNIIIIVLDAVRAKNVSAYGYPVKTTPCLDAFAAESILFKRAFSPATWTIPTHASLLTGLYLSQHRIESVKADRYFNEAIVPIPTALHSWGYCTAAFSQNMLFNPKYHLGGFERFYDIDGLFLDSSGPLKLVQRMSDSSTGLRRTVGRYVRKVTGPRLMLDAMSDWIEANNEETPFFVMANIANAHYPWAPPLDTLWRCLGVKVRHLRNQEFGTLEPYQFNSGKRQVSELHRQIWCALYDAAIMHVDRAVGRFLRRLCRWKGWSNTIVVITADHGEMLGDYQDIVGHMLTLHDNLLHVPLIVRHPTGPAGLKVEGVVQTLDLYPSILEWSGCPIDKMPSVQLQRPTLSKRISTASDPSGFAFAEEDYTDSYDPVEGLLKVNSAMDPRKYPRRQIAIRSDTHKYIWSDDYPEKFYDLRADVNEKHNLINTDAPADQAILRELRQALEAWRSKLEILPPTSVDNVAEVDTVIEDRLRSLGYIA